jgi:hypothetical protein
MHYRFAETVNHAGRIWSPPATKIRKVAITTCLKRNKITTSSIETPGFVFQRGDNRVYQTHEDCFRGSTFVCFELSDLHISISMNHGNPVESNWSTQGLEVDMPVELMLRLIDNWEKFAADKLGRLIPSVIQVEKVEVGYNVLPRDSQEIHFSTSSEAEVYLLRGATHSPLL